MDINISLTGLRLFNISVTRWLSGVETSEMKATFISGYLST